MSFVRPRSRQTYTWNHLRPLLTAATSSMDRVPIVDSVYGSRARAAALATSSSPPGLAILVKPVGASTSGTGSDRPSRVVEVSMAPTSHSTRGRNSSRRNASAFRRMVSSSSAPPSM